MKHEAWSMEHGSMEHGAWSMEQSSSEQSWRMVSMTSILYWWRRRKGITDAPTIDHYAPVVQIHKLHTPFFIFLPTPPVPPIPPIPSIPPSTHPPDPLPYPSPRKVSSASQSELLLHFVSSALCCFTCTIGRSRGPLLDRIRSLLTLIFSLCATLGRTDFKLTQDPLDAVGNSGKDGLWRTGRAMPEVVCIASGCRSKFLSGATLIIGDSIRVQVGLQLRLRPGVKR